MAGQIINRGERKWAVRVFLGRDGNGKRTYQNRTVHGTKREAEKVLADLLTKRSMGPTLIDVDRVLVGELLDDLERDYRLNGKDEKFCESIVRLHLRPFFGAMRAARVTSQTVREYCDVRLTGEPAVATVNRSLALLKRAFNLGARSTPAKVHSVPYIQLFREHNTRRGFFEHAEFQAMRDALPDFLKPVLSFGYFTGCRRKEILSLKWEQVDLRSGVVRLEVGTTKSKDGRIIPLAPELLEVMKMHRQSCSLEQPNCLWVFHRDGDRIQQFNKEWNAAAQVAGLVDENGTPSKLFHDNRRSAVRNLVRSGTSEDVAMKISGHKTRSIFSRYNVSTEADIRQGATRLGEYLKAVEEKAAAERHTIGTLAKFEAVQ